MSTINEDQTASKDWLEIVRERVATIRFGSVQITVHEGRVTQVEAIEKTRIASDSTPQRLHGSPKSRGKP
jgi:hypothetical protein